MTTTISLGGCVGPLAFRWGGGCVGLPDSDTMLWSHERAEQSQPTNWILGTFSPTGKLCYVVGASS